MPHDPGQGPLRRTVAASGTDHRQVLDFWFGAPAEDGYGKSRKQWFEKSDDFDDLIRERFGTLVDDALDGSLEHWSSDMSNPLRALAAVVVLDQFTRNIFRGTAKMVAGDARALAAARRMVDAGVDRMLLPVQRQFCYLPFEHAEDPQEQERSIALFASLAHFAETADLLRWAVAHKDLIDRFGRFPHRNEFLGRQSTPEELAYLAQPGSGF